MLATEVNGGLKIIMCIPFTVLNDASDWNQLLIVAKYHWKHSHTYSVCTLLLRKYVIIIYISGMDVFL